MPTEYAATSGQPTDAAEAGSAAPSTEPTFAVLALNLITPSLTNPRKTFDQAKLAELAESIKAGGVHQPVLVRPLPASRMEDTFRDRKRADAGEPLPTHELVAGERRYRACKAIGLDVIPALVRSLTDNQVLEIQLVENLQRDDLAELEEAEGYAALVAATGIDKAAIGDKIGRSRGYVYQRLKLLDLCAKAREALREGKMDTSTAVLVARIPDEKLQLKALKAFTETDYSGDARMGHRAKHAWIQQNVMLKLKDARFSIKDASLMPDAGSCSDCPKRTGANPDLFSDVDAPDLCTDPACYHGKEASHTAAIVEKARHKGVEVIEGKEALELKPQQWRGITGYSQLDDELVHDRAKGKTVPLRSVLTKAELKGNVKLFIDPHTKEPVEVVPAELLKAARDKLNPVTAQDKRQSEEEDEEDTKARLAQEYEDRWRVPAVEAVERGLAEGKVQRFEVPMLRLMLRHLANYLWEYSSDDLVAKVLQIPEEVDIPDAIAGAVTAVPDLELGARICTLLLRDEADPGNGYSGRSSDTTAIDCLAGSCGVDVAAIQAGVKKEMKAEAAKRAKDAKAATEGKATQKATQAARPPKAKKAGAKAAAEAFLKGEPDPEGESTEQATDSRQGDLLPVQAWPFPRAGA